MQGVPGSRASAVATAPPERASQRSNRDPPSTRPAAAMGMANTALIKEEPAERGYKRRGPDVHVQY